MTTYRNENKSRFHVFLLMGQSNMIGYGCVDPSDPWQSGDKDPVPGILVLDGQCLPDAPALDPASPMEWRPGAHPRHLRQATSQFGLGMDFAKRYRAAHPDITVGLIPAAWGGAAIDTLNKGSILYGNTLEKLTIEATCRRHVSAGSTSAAVSACVAGLVALQFAANI